MLINRQKNLLIKILIAPIQKFTHKKKNKGDAIYTTLSPYYCWNFQFQILQLTMKLNSTFHFYLLLWLYNNFERNIEFHCTVITLNRGICKYIVVILHCTAMENPEKTFYQSLIKSCFFRTIFLPAIIFNLSFDIYLIFKCSFFFFLIFNVQLV